MFLKKVAYLMLTTLLVCSFSYGVDTTYTAVDTGWNVISLARDLTDERPFREFTVYELNDSLGRWETVDSLLEIGEGYMLLSVEDTLIPTIGDTFLSYTDTLCAGWNLIGALSVPVPARCLYETPEIIHPIFKSNNETVGPYDTLYPTKGYRVRCSEPTTFTLTTCSPDSFSTTPVIEWISDLPETLCTGELVRIGANVKGIRGSDSAWVDSTKIYLLGFNSVGASVGDSLPLERPRLIPTDHISSITELDSLLGYRVSHTLPISGEWIGSLKVCLSAQNEVGGREYNCLHACVVETTCADTSDTSESEITFDWISPTDSSVIAADSQLIVDICVTGADSLASSSIVFFCSDYDSSSSPPLPRPPGSRRLPPEYMDITEMDSACYRVEYDLSSISINPGIDSFYIWASTGAYSDEVHPVLVTPPGLLPSTGPCIFWSDSVSSLAGDSSHLDGEALICGDCGVDSLAIPVDDTASIEVWAHLLGDTSDSLEVGYTPTRNAFLGFNIDLETIDTLPCDSTIKLCIAGTDTLGNRSSECVTRTIEASPPEPCFTLLSPDSALALTEYRGQVRICGNCPTDCDSSHIDSSSITFIGTEDHSDLSISENGCMGFDISFSVEESLVSDLGRLYFLVHASNMEGFREGDTLLIDVIDTSHTHILRTKTFISSGGTLYSVPNILVKAKDYTTDSLINSAFTSGSRGVTHFELPNDTFRISVSDTAGRFYDEFYDSTHDPFLAEPYLIDIYDPDTLEVAFLLDSVEGRYRIRGRATDEGGHPASEIRAIVISSEEDEEWTRSTMTDPSGFYDISVPTGNYYILGYSPDYIPEFHRGEILWDSARTVAVSDSDLTGINFTLRAISSDTSGALLRGRSYTAEDTAFSLTREWLPGSRIYLKEEMGDSADYYSATISDFEGKFEFRNIPEGNYQIIGDKIFYEYDQLSINVTSDEIYEDLHIHLSPKASIYDSGLTGERKENSRVKATPNPFSNTTVIQYSVSRKTDVKFKVFDIHGRPVKTLVDKKESRGHYLIKWSPKDLQNGVYYGRLKAGKQKRTVKLIHIE